MVFSAKVLPLFGLLLLPLVGCANDPLGQSLKKSLTADPRLTQQSPPAAIANPTPQPTAAPSPEPTPAPTVSSGADIAKVPSFADSTDIGLAGSSEPNSTKSPTPTPASTPTPLVKAINFADLDKTPKQLRQYVEDLATLGILTPASARPKSANAKPSQPSQPMFNPNGSMTRREFVRWLVSSNNRLNGDRPARQIRLAVDTSEPAFKDVPRTDPDFAVIQGLAEAGLLSSRISGGGNNNITFRPNAPLTRETLLQWKVPVDIREPLPTANIENVKQTWGFQDASRIDGGALRAVLADFQNGEQANIRRTFGYTTLLQPKKPVTRAEAAASLWYFGYQGEGESAQTLLQPPSPVTSPSSTPDSPNPLPSSTETE